MEGTNTIAEDRQMCYKLRKRFLSFTDIHIHVRSGLTGSYFTAKQGHVSMDEAKSDLRHYDSE